MGRATRSERAAEGGRHSSRRREEEAAGERMEAAGGVARTAFRVSGDNSSQDR